MRLIATDGVFSMDGSIAKLKEICDLADRYGALVMVDDSHATGFIGARGRGSHELRGVIGRIDILTGTLGKALGGASGGYVAARKEIVGWLRQRSRPYLFSNSIAPPVAAATIQVLDLLESLAPSCASACMPMPRYFREQMQGLGFNLHSGRASHHSRSCWAMRRWPSGSRSACRRSEFTSWLSPFRSCPMEKREFARK